MCMLSKYNYKAVEWYICFYLAAIQYSATSLTIVCIVIFIYHVTKKCNYKRLGVWEGFRCLKIFYKTYNPKVDVVCVSKRHFPHFYLSHHRNLQTLFAVYYLLFRWRVTLKWQVYLFGINLIKLYSPNNLLSWYKSLMNIKFMHLLLTSDNVWDLIDN